jgi:hypothetical protein
VRLALRAIATALAPRRRAFLRALDDPRAAQNAVLRNIVAATSRTEYGRAHRVDARDDYHLFTAKLPIVTYDDLLPWIERQIEREDGQLVVEPVLFYERTSGSTAPSKMIPVTRALRRSFHSMFLVWLEDILRRGPRLERGTMYISATALRDGGKTPRCVPIGANSDVDFLERRFGRLLQRFLVPLEAGPEVISVWNPILLDAVERLASVRLVSCWSTGAESLRERFPNAIIQHKGLLATEAPITIPLFDAAGFVPVLDEVFLEFEDSQGRVVQLADVTVGEEYAVIVSQKGGLVRYRIGDRVRVSHLYRGTPCLDFIGREGVSDLAGEKLSEGFAGEVLAGIGNFAVLLPERLRYLVVADRGDAAAIAAHAEESLLRSHRYREARYLGQLAPVRAVVYTGAARVWLEYFSSKGMRVGDIKPPSLVRDRDDARALAELLTADASPVQ